MRRFLCWFFVTIIVAVIVWYVFVNLMNPSFDGNLMPDGLWTAFNVGVATAFVVGMLYLVVHLPTTDDRPSGIVLQKYHVPAGSMPVDTSSRFGSVEIIPLPHLPELIAIEESWSLYLEHDDGHRQMHEISEEQFNNCHPGDHVKIG